MTVTARVDGKLVVVGRGHGVAGPDGIAEVAVKLTPLGRALARKPGGARFGVHAAIVPSGGGATVARHSTARAVARQVIVPRPVVFDTDSAKLRQHELRYLLRLRKQLAGVRKVGCTGYTDSRNSRGYNRDLGLARARAVCAVLRTGRRVGAVKVTRGESAPWATNATPHGMQLNRRAEITLIYR